MSEHSPIPTGGNTEIKTTAKKKQSHKLELVLSLIALILLIILLMLILDQRGVIVLPWKSAQVVTGSSVSGSIKEGTPGMTLEEILAAMQAEADASKVHFKINARPVFADGKSPGNLFIVNPADNAYNMKVEIHLDETNQLVFESGLMPPNSYIDEDTLLIKLEKGEYAATATLLSYDLDDPSKQTSKATASLIITIEN